MVAAGRPGSGDAAEGEVTRVWRPDDVEEFTVDLGDDLVDVYADYRNPVVERVEGGADDGGDPETETVGRLDRIVASEN